ncbi:uncharacterized protein M6B38_389255 [Iris pallida]|uniref:Uncharacterized protein n=1 Tax=Iris pallida TaxID=29817 RepID=A0AAX6G2A1_IRIPA|nr:uncharacterized protein M6B38_389255 [Iris pallida]
MMISRGSQRSAAAAAVDSRMTEARPAGARLAGQKHESEGRVSIFFFHGAVHWPS